MIFDGDRKLILLEENEEVLDVKMLYYKWKEWSANVYNIRYPLALRYVGGDVIPTGRVGLTYFLINGWKIKPYSKNYTLVVDGNLYTDDGSNPFVKADGDVNVLIINKVSNLIDIVTPRMYNNNGGSTPPTTIYQSDENDDWTVSQ